MKTTEGGERGTQNGAYMNNAERRAFFRGVDTAITYGDGV